MKCWQALLGGACLLAACSAPPQDQAAVKKSPAPHGPVIGEASARSKDAPPVILAQATAAPAVTASESVVGQAVNTAAWAPTPMAGEAKRDVLIRLQVLLDRAHFSPGVIDGREGGNLKKAIAAYETASGLPSDGLMDEAVWSKLTAADTQAALTDYVITEDDVKGPFVAEIPSDYKGMSKLSALSYRSPQELLAEKFHMDEALLAALNPGADFTQAGTKIVVAAPAADTLPATLTRIEVDKTARQVRAYAGDQLVAAYPATVGSTERPAPEGEWAVKAVALNPNYNYDPSRLTFGDMKAGKMTIPPGPNNPVGSVWIALTKETYGIHGAPEPRLVGKTASHGCIRLTNWDARELASAAKKGTPVVFVGAEAPPAKA
jgi:lipoprotein-anchoring transpeptidase ErfK/SrfK